ncbi:inositol monophosphatase, partial [bacterium]|nr:inositol monophosphatase [bacterium]
MNDNLDQLVAIAARTAKETGDFLQQTWTEDLKIVKDSPHDIKIEADKIAEQKILDELTTQTCFSILCEEKGLVQNTKASGQLPHWVVDPLDGSFNYYRGIPPCCISIALWLIDKPILGVVYDFNRKELYTGIVGKGA